MGEKAVSLETDKGIVNLECSVNCEVGSEAELTRGLYGCQMPNGTDAGISEQEKRSLFELPVDTEISLVA